MVLDIEKYLDFLRQATTTWFMYRSMLKIVNLQYRAPFATKEGIRYRDDII
jgi:hypothetical protein